MIAMLNRFIFKSFRGHLCIALFLIGNIAFANDSSLKVQVSKEREKETFSIAVDIEGGSPEYQIFLYDKDPMKGGTVIESSQENVNLHTFINISPGNYLILVKDKRGAISGKPVKVSSK